MQGYLERFNTRLSPGNVVRIKQVIMVIKAFQSMMATAAAASEAPPGSSLGKQEEGAKARVGSVMSVAEFSIATKIDNINLFDLLR